MLKIYRESTSSMHMLIRIPHLSMQQWQPEQKVLSMQGWAMGAFTKNAFSGLESAANKGVLVVRSSRTGSGLVVDSNSEWQKTLLMLVL